MSDAYPSSNDLDEIRKAEPSDVLRLARTIWHFPDFWRTKPAPRGEVGTWHLVSTGGWSGNEEIIGAMMENVAFWLMHWRSSRRGGHYEFSEEP